MNSTPPPSQQFSFSVSGSPTPPKSIVAPIYVPSPASSLDDIPPTATVSPTPKIVHLNLPFSLPKGTTVIVSDLSAIKGPSLSSPHSFGPAPKRPKPSATYGKTKPVTPAHSGPIQPNGPPPTKIVIPKLKAPAKKKAAPPPRPPKLKPTPKSDKSKPLVFLERSYDICRKMIENMPNYEELKAKLKYPHMIERDPLALSGTSSVKSSEPTSKSDDVPPADSVMPLNEMPPVQKMNTEAAPLTVKALRNHDGFVDIPMDASISTMTASETSMSDASELNDFELPITQQDVDPLTPMDTVISAFHMPIASKNTEASSPVEASIPQPGSDQHSPMDTATTTFQIPATEIDTDTVIISQQDRDLNLPMDTIIDNNTVQSEASVSDVLIPVQEMNAKKAFSFSIEALLTQKMKAKKASSFSIDALLTQIPRQKGDLQLPMDTREISINPSVKALLTQEVNAKKTSSFSIEALLTQIPRQKGDLQLPMDTQEMNVEDASSLPVESNLPTTTASDTAAQNEAPISDDQLPAAERNTRTSSSPLKTLLTNQIPEQDDEFLQSMDTNNEILMNSEPEASSSTQSDDLREVHTTAVDSPSLPPRSVRKRGRPITSSTPYVTRSFKKVTSCCDCSYMASDQNDLKKHIRTMHPHSVTALPSLNKSSIKKKSILRVKHHLRPAAQRKEPIIHQVFIRRETPEPINDEVALMSDPIDLEPRTETSIENQQELTSDQVSLMSDPLDPEPGKESSMENQQEMTADQTTIMLDTINIGKEEEITTIHQDPTRHDQELSVADKEARNGNSTIRSPQDFAECVAKIAAALNPFGSIVVADQVILTPVVIKQEEESDDDMPNIQPMDSVADEAASDATSDGPPILADIYNDPDDELVLKMDSPEGAVYFDHESMDKCGEQVEQQVEQHTETQAREDEKTPIELTNVSPNKESNSRQISSTLNQRSQLSDEEKMEKLQRELAALRGEARNLAAHWKKQKDRSLELLNCPSP